MSTPNAVLIKVSDERVSAMLGSLIAVLKDTTPTMRALSGVMISASKRAFMTRSDPATGTPWAALSASRQRERARRGRSASNILQDKQYLIRSISGAGSPGAVRQIGPNYALVGTNVSYAAAHQFGATITREAGEVKLHFGRRKGGKWGFVTPNAKGARYGMKAARKAHTITIPARPFLGVSETHLDDMLEIITRHIHRAMGENGV